MKRKVILAWPLIFGFVLVLVGAAIYLGSVTPLMDAQAERDSITYNIESEKFGNPSPSARQLRLIEFMGKRLSEFDEMRSIPNLTLINRIGIVTLVIGAVASISAALVSRTVSEER